ncbi:MAG: DUF4124 domain-containing protein [Zoogloeaceae bacterium]|nr:DUF4124 domain-containing protein [Zoogloeaceae bacterium]
MQKHFLVAVALVLGIAAAPPVAAQVYKWKDAEGRTVISDRPRSGGGKEDLVIPGVQSTPANDPSAQPAAPTLADKEIEFRKRQQEQRESAAKAEAEKQEADKKAENCKRAQNDLKALESGRRVSVTDESGASIPIDDARRQAEIEKAREYLRSQCGG